MPVSNREAGAVVPTVHRRQAGLNTAIHRSGDLGSPRTRIDLMRLADNSASFSRGQIYGAAGRSGRP